MCYVQFRALHLMIPARIECPTGWSREYYGYFMSETNQAGRHSTTFECVDKDPDMIPGESASTNSSLIYHVEAGCDGLVCPPYDPEKEVTCMVCTK